MDVERGLSKSIIDVASRPFLVDVGGEGRHESACNINPRRYKTLGPQRGQPIPRLVMGRADSIPLPNECADAVIVERTPLSKRAIIEIARIAKSGAVIVLRHAQAFGMDPHQLAKQILNGVVRESECKIGAKSYRETTIILHTNTNSPRI